MSAVETLSARFVQTRLGELTERWATELATPTVTVPEWSDLEWRLAQAAAAIHGVSALLQTTLRWRGPAPWQRFLEEQRAHTRERQLRIMALLERIEEQARPEGLSLMPLKGAALHRCGLYRPGERPMADLDLLVPAGEAEAAARLLSRLGFIPAGVTWKHRSFEPPSRRLHALLGEHCENPVKIDLHTRIAERLPLAPIEFSDLVRPGRWAAGLNAYPSRAALMLHLLAHTAGTMVSRGVRLIQLVDIAWLSRDMTPADWEELTGYTGESRRLWWAHAPLALTAKYFRSAVPARVLEQLRRESHWLLKRATKRRTLAEVSYAHVFIDPIPGLPWARSAHEMIRYVLSRIRPSREQLAQLDLLGRTGPWSAAPEWYTQSQARRVWQWLTHRPTRIEAMQPVRAALAPRL